MIIYNGDNGDLTNFESSSFLKVNSCGVQVVLRDKTDVIRNRGRVDYHILFMCAGESEVFYENKFYTLNKGNIVFYPPNTRQEYILSENAKTVWLHFTGFEVKSILSEAKVGFGVHKIPYSQLLEKMLLQLIAEHNNIYKITNEKGLLLSFLYSLGKILNRDFRTESKISECISFITTNYNVNITVAELAKFCNLSESRFLHLFKTATGTSPHLFQQDLRLNDAKLLLSSTKLSVSEISAQSGYNNPLYFSRVFKRKTGLSPMKYREIYLEK